MIGKTSSIAFIFMAAVVIIRVVGVVLELKFVVEINLVRLSYCFTNHCFQFYSSLKLLYISNKMDRFSYRGGCGVRRHSMHIEAFNWLGLQINSFRLLVIYCYAKQLAMPL